MEADDRQIITFRFVVCHDFLAKKANDIPYNEKYVYGMQTLNSGRNLPTSELTISCCWRKEMKRNDKVSLFWLCGPFRMKIWGEISDT